MEKVLLIFALLRSAHLCVTAAVKAIKLAFRRPAGAQEQVAMPPPSSDRPDRQEQQAWVVYDTPTFIRRGIPMPTLEPVSKAKKKCRRKAKAKPAVAPAFEVVA